MVMRVWRLASSKGFGGWVPRKRCSSKKVCLGRILGLGTSMVGPFIGLDKALALRTTLDNPRPLILNP